MSSDLIDRLSTDLEPVDPHRPRRRLVGGLVAGGCLVLLAFVLWPDLAFRTDLVAAVAGASFWLKLGFTLSIAVTGAWAVAGLARPDGQTPGDRTVPLVVWLTVAVIAAAVLATAPLSEWVNLAMGGTARRCLSYIVLLSVPPLGLILFVLRRAAPTRLARAGWAAGLAAGGLGASVYSLGCGESSPVFLALWYALGIVLVGVVGAVAGRWVLRW